MVRFGYLKAISVCESEITQYFEASESRETREDLIFAVSKIPKPGIAIDCGCGAGADIAYLVSRGFTVHGFDLEKEAISRCKSRFMDNRNVTLTESTFSDFDYPKASLVVADASLFFCPETDFPDVWNKISECLQPKGIFCGSFLGAEDTMAAPGVNPARLWPEVSVFEESEVIKLFQCFEILRLHTHRSTGTTAQGTVHDWHIFQVVARI